MNPEPSPCACLPGTSGWNPECPSHGLLQLPVLEFCSDDHSNGQHCAIHGYDDSVPAPQGFRWHRVRRIDGQVYSALVKAG